MDIKIKIVRFLGWCLLVVSFFNIVVELISNAGIPVGFFVITGILGFLLAKYRKKKISQKTISNDDEENEKQELNWERIILMLAKRNKGILSISDVALEANISTDDAKKYLEIFVSKGIAELRIKKNGAIVYVIIELLENDSFLEDF